MFNFPRYNANQGNFSLSPSILPDPGVAIDFLSLHGFDASNIVSTGFQASDICAFPQYGSPPFYPGGFSMPILLLDASFDLSVQPQWNPGAGDEVQPPEQLLAIEDRAMPIKKATPRTTTESASLESVCQQRCSECGKTFKRAEHLKRHRVT